MSCSQKTLLLRACVSLIVYLNCSYTFVRFTSSRFDLVGVLQGAGVHVLVEVRVAEFGAGFEDIQRAVTGQRRFRAQLAVVSDVLS